MDLKTEYHIEMSDDIGAIAAALSKAQGEMPIIEKNKTAKIYSQRTKKSYTYKYADLADTLKATQKILSANELAVTQPAIPSARNMNAVTIVTMLMHSSGQWIRGYLEMSWSGGPQDLGTVLTYGRRYGYQAITGCAGEDDDAEIAQKEVADLKNQYTTDMLKALEDADKIKLLQLADELDEAEYSQVWKGFNSKQKAAIREMLQDARKDAVE